MACLQIRSANVHLVTKSDIITVLMCFVLHIFWVRSKANSAFSFLVHEDEIWSFATHNFLITISSQAFVLSMNQKRTAAENGLSAMICCCFIWICHALLKLSGRLLRADRGQDVLAARDKTTHGGEKKGDPKHFLSAPASFLHQWTVACICGLLHH